MASPQFVTEASATDRSVPATQALPSEPDPAGAGLRAVAQAINIVLALVVLGALFVFGSSIGILYCALLATPLALIQWAFLAARGQDIGKLVVGIRIVRVTSHARAGWGRTVLLRSVLTGILYAVPLLGQLFLLVDTALVYRDDGRCLHDRLAGTEVVRVRRNLTLFDWAFTQVGAFLSLLGQVVLLGLIAAIARREFSWRGFTVGLVIMVLGIFSIGIAVFSGPLPLYGNRELLLWGGSLGVMLLAGFVTGRLGHRVGFWECYLATLITVALVVVELAKGWNNVLGIGPTDTQGYLQFLITDPPGVRYLGSMWQRLLALASLGGFLLSLVGGSFGYIFFPEGRFDPSFDIELFVARRHMRGRGGLVSVTAVVAVIGIALGVAALVTVTAVMSGYQEDIQTKILSTNAHLVVQKYGIDFTEWRQIEKEALQVPGVLTASPFTFNEAMLSVGDEGIGVLLKGVGPQTAGKVTAIQQNLCKTITLTGRCTKFPDHTYAGELTKMLRPAEPIARPKAGSTSVHGKLPAIIVGSQLFKKIDRPIGTPVTITTPVGIAGAHGNAPRRMEFRLAGAFRSGMHEFDSHLAYLELGASQRLMGLGKAVNGVEFRVADPEHVERIDREVLTAIGHYPYRTLDWRELNSGIFTALKLQKIVMFLVLSFIVVVAAFNIASTLFMSVVEKAHEIAVLKSMGSRDVSVMKMFVLQGWAVGGVGTVLGCLLGLGASLLISELNIGIAADVYMVQSLQVRIRPLEVGVTVLAALAISHLAAIYPALKAARQRPIDAMRYDEV